MIENQKIRPAEVIGPLGEALLLAVLRPEGLHQQGRREALVGDVRDVCSQ